MVRKYSARSVWGVVGGQDAAAATVVVRVRVSRMFDRTLSLGVEINTSDDLR